MIWFEVLFSVAAVGFGVWQLIDLKREKKKDEAKRNAERQMAPGPTKGEGGSMQSSRRPSNPSPPQPSP